MGADKSAENTPYALKFNCPNCLPKPKSLGFLWKRRHWASVVRGSWIVVAKKQRKTKNNFSAQTANCHILFCPVIFIKKNLQFFTDFLVAEHCKNIKVRPQLRKVDFSYDFVKNQVISLQNSIQSVKLLKIARNDTTYIGSNFKVILRFSTR